MANKNSVQLSAGDSTTHPPRKIWHTDSEGLYWRGITPSLTAEQLFLESKSVVKDLLKTDPGLVNLGVAEIIVGVSILYRNTAYSMPKPNRHHNVIRMIGGIEDEDLQGFITNTGRFVDRVEGLAIALAANQVLDVKNIRGGLLYSEDLW